MVHYSGNWGFIKVMIITLEFSTVALIFLYKPTSPLNQFHGASLEFFLNIHSNNRFLVVVTKNINVSDGSEKHQTQPKNYATQHLTAMVTGDVTDVNDVNSSQDCRKTCSLSHCCMTWPQAKVNDSY